jgi:cytochrome c oxidase cbb3-type subunit III
MKTAALALLILAAFPSCRLVRRAPNQAQARGAATYTRNCATCHGGNGFQSRAPDLRFTPFVEHDVQGNLLGPFVRAGRPTLGMPAFSNLTPAEISDLALYLHSISDHMHERKEVAEAALTGNAAEGKAYFARNCSACHSPTGDMAAIGRKYAPVLLQQRFLFPANSAMPSAVVTAADGEKYEGRVMHDDEFNIAIVARDGWYRSFPRDAVKVDIRDPFAAHRALLEKYTNPDIHNLLAFLVTLK